MSLKALVALFGGKRKSSKVHCQSHPPARLVRSVKAYSREPRVVYVRERRRFENLEAPPADADADGRWEAAAEPEAAACQHRGPEDNGLFLPCDVLLLVFAYAPVQDYARCSVVCGNWAALARQAAARNRLAAQQLVAEGLLHMTTRNIPQPSLELFEQAFMLYPKYADASFWMAKCLLTDGQEKAAVRCLELGIRQLPPVVERLKLQACLNCAQQNDAKASRLLELALPSAPLDASLHFELGFCYHGLQKYPQAIHCYTRALELRYERTFVLLANRANCLFHIGRSQEALEDLERSLAINCFYDLALRTRAIISTHLGKPDLAFQDYSTVIDHSTSVRARSDAYCSRALCFGNVDEADLQRAQEADPTNPEPMRCKTAVLLGRGQVTDAVAEVTKWIDTNGMHPDVHVQLAYRGELFATVHDLARAMDDYRLAIQALLRTPYGLLSSNQQASDRLLSYRERLRNLTEQHRQAVVRR
eukprot:EG_transcript_4257